ncbi:MAG TPA: phospholipase D family protein [Verrucomicrobiales bacterium]|nr:phospholipase D family protein [Verrucomicrobiales bacterium]HIL69776.1 phospholipase D family protein [Verrucomicrobiota bacterium]
MDLLKQILKRFDAETFVLLVFCVLLNGCVVNSGQKIEAAQALFLDRDAQIRNITPISSEYQDLAKQLETGLGHYLTMINIGDDALLSRIHLIRTATTSIDIQTYLWIGDECGEFVFEELLKAARRGVKVRLLVDQLIPISSADKLTQWMMAHANIEFRFFNPISTNAVNLTSDYARGLFLRFRKANRRMHHKLFLVDRRIGIIGGRNIQNAYFDRDPVFNFKDRDVLVIGNSVDQMSQSFDEFWNHELAEQGQRFMDIASRMMATSDSSDAGFKGISDRSKFNELSIAADQYALSKQRSSLKLYPVDKVRYFSDSPEKNRRNATNLGTVESDFQAIREYIENSEQRLVFQTPYLILTSEAVRMFSMMRKNNPDLRIICSSNSLASTDKVSVFAASYKKRKRQVKKLRFEIHEFKPVPEDIVEMMPRYKKVLADYYEEFPEFSTRYSTPLPLRNKGSRLCIHAKSIVIDSRISIIGSHNFDPRSANWNTECLLLIDDENFSKDLEKEIGRDTSTRNSWTVARRRDVPVISFFSGIIASFSAMLPILDIWPFRYTTCYELKKNQEPVPLYHSDFSQRYRTVGSFPEVNLTFREIKLRLANAFTGFAAPLM